MNKIEEEFYKAFEIEPRYGCHNDISEEALPCDTACEECAWYWDEFPKITDRILLELICILCKEAYTYYEPFYGTTFEDLPSCVSRRKDNEAKTIFLKPMLQDEYEKLGKELEVEIE